MKQVAAPRLVGDRMIALASLDLSANKPEAVLDQVARVATELLPASLGASVILWDQITETYVTAASTVPGQEPISTASAIRRSGGATRHIIDSREPLVVADASKHPLARGALITRFGVGAFSGVPIEADDRVLGVLYVLDAAPRDYDASDLAFLQILAARAATAIANADYIEQLQGTAADHRDTVFRARGDRKRADAVARVANALMAIDEPGQDLQIVVDGIGQALKADRVILVTLDMAAESVIHQTVGGSESSRIGELDFGTLMAGLTGWAISNKRTARSDGPDERESAEVRQRRTDESSGPLVVVPLVVSDGITGTLTVIRRQGREPFSGPDVATLEVMAAQATLALERHRLNAEVRHSLDETQSMLDVALDLMAKPDASAIMAAVAEATVTALRVDSAEVHFVDIPAQRLIDSIAVGPAAEEICEPVDFARLWGGLAGWAMLHEQGVLSANADDERETASTRASRKANDTGPLAVVPLKAAGEVLGTLTVANRTGGRAFDDRDLKLMTALAAMGASAMNAARLLAANEELAHTDALTGLPNRRQLEIVGEGIFNSASRYGHPMTVLVLDVDGFKQINDTHGHIQGDEVLKAVARACRIGVRTADIIGRWGGDEFLAILPQTDDDGARATALRIIDEQQDQRVALSIGIGLMREHDTDLFDVIDRADAAMYAAKATRGNVVV